MKKMISLSLSLVFLCGAKFNVSAVENSARSAVVIEAESGSVVYEKNSNERLGPASTTKIMTAVVALENCPIDKIVSVSPSAVGTEGSSAYLYAGERVSMETLLYALMLQSANDAAEAIAYEIAGSIEGFAAMMNEKAAELGLENTHFDNPHGLDGKTHYTSAYDLAMITRYALENETFRKIVSTKRKFVPMESGSAERLFVNHNRLLSSYNDIIGVKTGFTKKCGRTLVSAAKKDDVTLICVTLDDGNDWRDHRSMLDLGFSLYERVDLCSAGDEACDVHVCGGDCDTAALVFGESVSVTLPRSRGNVEVKIAVPHFLYAPVSLGQTVGFAEYSVDGKIIAKVRLVSSSDILKMNIRKDFLFWKK